MVVPHSILTQEPCSRSYEKMNLILMQTNMIMTNFNEKISFLDEVMMLNLQVRTLN